MQALEQMRADIQIAAPALDAAMVEMRLHVLGVSVTVLVHKGEDLLSASFHPRVPGAQVHGSPRGCSRARVSRGRKP